MKKLTKTQQEVLKSLESGYVITRFIDRYYLTKQGESTPIKDTTVSILLSQKLIKRTNYTTLVLS